VIIKKPSQVGDARPYRNLSLRKKKRKLPMILISIFGDAGEAEVSNIIISWHRDLDLLRKIDALGDALAMLQCNYDELKERYHDSEMDGGEAAKAAGLPEEETSG
jgi:hypothetical protein